MKRLTVCILLAIATLGMGVIQAQDESALQVAASTSIIADVARNVGGDLVEVTSIVPVGADAHSFSPTPRDVAAIIEADLVLVNGMNLEEGLLEIIEANVSEEPVVVSMGVAVLSSEGHSHDHEGDDHAHEEDDDHDHEGDAEVIGVLGMDADCGDDHAHEGEDHSDEETHEEGHDDHDHGPCDAHVWTDPANVAIWANNIAAAFAAADPDNAEVYTDNAAAYIAELEALDAEIMAMVESIPAEARVIVTNHEFLAYFAAHYGFEVVGTVIPAASTTAEVNPRELAELVEVIEAEGVRAIFAETSSSLDLAETVAAEVGADVQVVTLYSESLSETDGPAATYIDYMRYNATQIVNALGG